MMKVLVACELSGVVRNAFLKKGHDAWSCDLEPAEDGSARHMQRDVRFLLHYGWDLMIAHPPYDRLCNAGVRWLKERNLWNKLNEGAGLFSDLWNAPIPKKCIENPIMHKYAKWRIRNYRKYSQIIQPWEHGHGETKATCLWLDGLPTLKPTDIVDGREARIHKMSPGPNRSRDRSRTYTGIAAAMAEQWG